MPVPNKAWTQTGFGRSRLTNAPSDGWKYWNLIRYLQVIWPNQMMVSREHLGSLKLLEFIQRAIEGLMRVISLEDLSTFGFNV